MQFVSAVHWLVLDFFRFSHRTPSRCHIWLHTLSISSNHAGCTNFYFNATNWHGKLFSLSYCGRALCRAFLFLRQIGDWILNYRLDYRSFTAVMLKFQLEYVTSNHHFQLSGMLEMRHALLFMCIWRTSMLLRLSAARDCFHNSEHFSQRISI